MHNNVEEMRRFYVLLYIIYLICSYPFKQRHIHVQKSFLLAQSRNKKPSLQLKCITFQVLVHRIHLHRVVTRVRILLSR